MVRLFRPQIASALLVLTLAGCIVEAPAEYVPPPPRGGEVEQVAPPISVRSGAILGSKVEVVAVSVTPGSIGPGRGARVSILFRVIEELQGDLRVFVHGEDPAGRASRLIFDHPPANGRHPTTNWKKGELVRDEFQVNVPRSSNMKALNLWGGLWDPKTNERLPVSNASDVRNDGHHRVLLVQIPVAEF